MARVKLTARKSTGRSLKQRLRLAKRQPRSPTTSDDEDDHRDYDFDWLYVMLTLINVGHILEENMQTADAIADFLADEDNAYTILNYYNVLDQAAHIQVGKQTRTDGTVDINIMIGVMIDEHTDAPSYEMIRAGLNLYLAREGRSFDRFRSEDVCIMRQSAENKYFVNWNQHIINIMDEVAEKGDRLF